MSNIQFAARVTNFAEALAFLDGAWSKKIGYATKIRRSRLYPNLIELVHHDTGIITWEEGTDYAILYTDGYVSRTTANRLNYFTPDNYRVGSRITSHEEFYRVEALDGSHYWKWDGTSLLTLAPKMVNA